MNIQCGFCNLPFPSVTHCCQEATAKPDIFLPSLAAAYLYLSEAYQTQRHPYGMSVIACSCLWEIDQLIWAHYLPFLVLKINSISSFQLAPFGRSREQTLLFISNLSPSSPPPISATHFPLRYNSVMPFPRMKKKNMEFWGSLCYFMQTTCQKTAENNYGKLSNWSVSWITKPLSRPSFCLHPPGKR